MSMKKDSDLVKILINFVGGEMMFWIGSLILASIKWFLNIPLAELVSGSFLGPASQGLVGNNVEAFSPTQIQFIMDNLIFWWLNTIMAMFSSLLLLSGSVAVVLTLIIPGVDIFTGPNAMDPMSLVAGFLFLVCWGVLPVIWIIRSFFIEKFKEKIG